MKPPYLGFGIKKLKEQYVSCMNMDCNFHTGIKLV